jgi:hypothetical protein
MEGSRAANLSDLARDPLLMKGIHEACDQWCMYCSATRHCLAYRCSEGVADTIEWDVGGTSSGGVGGGIFFFKALAGAEGRRAPPEIEVMFDRSAKGAKERVAAALRDPLENLGRNCMDVAEAYLASRPDVPFAIVHRAAGPTPLEAFAWYHALGPARVFRAILCAGEAAEGIDGRDVDALRAAKVALIAIDRTLAALPAMREQDDDPRLEFLETHLARLRAGVESRFPFARTFVREGLDGR